MKNGTKLILIILLFAQFSFGQINQLDTIPDDTLEIEEDIEIEIPPIQLTYKEIESLYLERKTIENIPDKEEIFPHLKLYFEQMDEGIHPFTTFEDFSFHELIVDTSELRIFMEDLKIEFDKEKKASSEQSIQRQ